VFVGLLLVLGALAGGCTAFERRVPNASFDDRASAIPHWQTSTGATAGVVDSPVMDGAQAARLEGAVGAWLQSDSLAVSIANGDEHVKVGAWLRPCADSNLRLEIEDAGRVTAIGEHSGTDRWEFVSRHIRAFDDTTAWRVRVVLTRDGCGFADGIVLSMSNPAPPGALFPVP
jgi:hypothetical protein